jgi:hypothetical protein
VTADKLLEPSAVRASANRWYAAQLAVAERCLGSYWPQHREWVEAYLKAELRERLIAIGWRPTNAG